jgi:general L-amino acid transport system substrate-binding protein
MRWLTLSLILASAPAVAAAEKPPLQCAGAVAPGLAYPDAQRHWAGAEIDLCGRMARAVGVQAVFLPIIQETDVPPPRAHDVVFLPAGDAPAGYVAGPVIADDEQEIMVPAGSPVRTLADLNGLDICVQPGSAEDANLITFFAHQKLRLQEFPFQEIDEMHDAYVAGRCEGISAQHSLLVGLRDNARRDDVILPWNVADNPVRVMTPAGDADWAEKVAFIVEGTSK